MDREDRIENENKMEREKGKGKRPTRKMKLRPKEPPTGKDPQEGENQPGKKAVRNLMLWLMIAVGFIVLAQILAFDQKTEVEVSFTEFKSLLNSGSIQRASVVENEFHGELYSSVNIFRPSGKGSIGDSSAVLIDDRFKVILPSNYVDSEVLAEWDNVGLKYDFQIKSMDWVGYLLQLSPWILIFVFWIIIMRRMQGGGQKGIFSFGKSKARVLTGKEPKITFDKVNHQSANFLIS